MSAFDVDGMWRRPCEGRAAHAWHGTLREGKAVVVAALRRLMHLLEEQFGWGVEPQPEGECCPS